MSRTEQLIEEWKKKLLDLSKRNNLLNFRTTKRGTLKIVHPGFSDLYDSIVGGAEFSFAKPSQAEEYEVFDSETGRKYGISIKSNAATLKDETTTLKGLRRRAKTIMEEQGINVLYLAFGFLRWKELPDSETEFLSPLLLVPVSLTIESVVEPYKLSYNDDEITVNPTLVHKLDHDFNLNLPEFDEAEGVDDFIAACRRVLKNHPGWSIEEDVFLSIFSFLKINMYYDLSKNVRTAEENPIIKAFGGDLSGLTREVQICEDLSAVDFDKDINPKDIFQVLDADSSQQEAIELAKRNVSFVLQGPPGTGKSQTITNIISESLAQGKTILFVSEKEAALNVVKHRLEQTNLLDFCLPMHSHKANKKEIISELYRTAGLSRDRVRENAIIQLDKLYNNRLRLDRISEQLHRSIAPLNMSVFEVNGELAVRENVPNFMFDIPNIQRFTQQDLHQILDKLELLRANVEHFYGNRFSPLWNECSLPTLSNADNYKFQASITEELSSAVTGIESKLKEFGFDSSSIKWCTVPKYLDILDIAAHGHSLPTVWLTSSVDEIKSVCNKWSDSFVAVADDRKAVEQCFNPGVEEFDSSSLLLAINSLKKLLSEKTNVSIESSDSDLYHASLRRIQGESQGLLEWMDGATKHLQSLFDSAFNENAIRIDDIGKLSVVAKSLLGVSGAGFDWFTKKRADEVSICLDELEAKKKEESAHHERVLEKYDQEVFNLDSKSLRQRFRAEYSSVFRFLKGSYRNDIRQIRSYSKSGKVSYNDALTLLNELNDYTSIQDWFIKNRPRFRIILGNEELYINPDFSMLRSTLSNVNVVIDYYRDAVPEIIKQLASSGFYDSAESRRHYDDLSALMNTQLADRIIRAYCGGDTTLLFNGVYKQTQLIHKTVEDVLQGWERLESFSNDMINNLTILTPLMRWQEFLGKLDDVRPLLNHYFSEDFDGIETDWSSIKKKMEWFVDLRHKASETSPNTDAFLTNVLKDKDYRIRCEDTRESIKASFDKENLSVSWFDNWFPEDHSIKTIPLADMKSIIDHYRANIGLLEGWLAYRRAYHDVENCKLDKFLSVVVNNDSVKPSDYSNIFIKQFYSIWLDYAMNRLPDLLTLSQVQREAVLTEFKNQDKVQLTIAQARIREMLSERLPNINTVATANDQLGILKHEYNKQRRQMPIRKLFNMIPELVMRLKPCLMMSPLSVSLFLENPGYVFDVVIFDEASQVKPENAIGSILRGRQVIIAGDSRQLPPTNFFQTTLSDDDLYDDDEEEDIAMEESILDSCSRVLPEQYLKWHYRSRDEHLIAFSNSKIYDNRLTTFPSIIDEGKDIGVEFEYVANGVYDRGGKKNNVKEAERVADLVFDHFQRHPGRSLGVIANSDSQARTIEDIIVQRRTNRTSFERFFNEELDEPFFVKSLESVQGDERDTIIFSIGYGKDAAGRMTQNFGPINRDGGERRLNVAVTRAKFNLKLVSSIGAESIEVTESTQSGPKLLKAYIDYAQRGMIALTGGLIEGNIVSFDSPFEESVYNFLREKGYPVETQVGCAGYRIDLGIKDPQNLGRYVLAVECDGAAYHASRYARERDRLRQEVLEGMGWKFHRIWSTEWIQSPASAKQALIRAVETAIFNAPMTTLFTPDDTAPTMNSFMEESDDTNCDEVDLTSLLDFEEYSLVDDNELIGTVENRISLLIKKEAPMHFDYLARRMAPTFGRERASSFVQNALRAYLRVLSPLVEVHGDFLYLRPRNSSYKTRINSGRRIEEICPDELEYAMLAVARCSVGLSEDSLIEATAHNIGFAHAKRKVKETLKGIFDKLIKYHKITVSPSGNISANR